MYLFIHHEFLLFKNQKLRAEERGDKIEKINVVDIYQPFSSNKS